MEILGCGYNGFGQLQTTPSKRCIFSPVKIVQESSSKSKASDKITKVTSSWNTVYILNDGNIWWQGFYNGEKSAFQTLETDTLQRNHVVDMDATCEMLYYISVDGQCFAVDIGSGQEVLVQERDHGSGTRFLKVAVGDSNTVAITGEYSSGFISNEDSSYIFRPFDCAVRFFQVYCGKEHVILLSGIHQVYSFGLGSRGQLGHGTTDAESQPRLLEALGSVSVGTISAGGWHSAAVSAIGDVYIWGWNESGQLGFPVQQKSASKYLDTSQDLHTNTSCDQPSQEKPHHGEKRTLEQDARPTAWTKKKTLSLKATKDGTDNTLCQSLGKGNFIEDGFETNTRSHDNQSHHKSKTFQTDTGCQKADWPLELHSMQDRVFQKPVTTSDEAIEDQNSDFAEESNCDNRHAVDMEECCNSNDAILFQPLPRILDFPNGQNVFKVSCGSRHTAAISEDGRLYTWGWAAHGQLGHGDTLTRDIPTMVKCFGDNQRVIDVSCGVWNTLIWITSYG